MAEVRNMKKNRLYVTKNVLKILSFSLVFTMTACSTKSENKPVEKNSNEPKIVETAPENEKKVVVEDETPVENEEVIEVVPEEPVENFNNENEVVSYFEKINQNLDETFTKENFHQLKETVKDKTFKGLVTGIEFLSNNKQIGGYYYSDLTDPVKAKVASIIESIDHKIVEHYPNYKEYLKEKYQIAYDGFHTLLDKAKGNIRETIGEETYDKIKDTKDEVKGKVKEKVDDLKGRAKDWYNRKKEEYQ